MTPQRVAWSKAYDFVSKDLDSVFAKLHNDIQNRCTIIDKSIRVKVAAWLKKLSEEEPNEVWKKNRNAYARLMLDQLKAGRLEEPFNAVPPSTHLPLLPKSLTYAYSKPKRSPDNHTKTTPSQQLESYLTSHGAPPSPLPCTLQNNNSQAADTPIAPRASSIPPMMSAPSAASAPGYGEHRYLSWALEGDLRHEGHAEDAGAERQRELELRVMQAEEMLLELSSILTHLQQQHEKQKHDSKGNQFQNMAYSGEQDSPHGPRYDHSFTEDVVQRAESALRGFTRTLSPARRSASVSPHREEYTSSSSRAYHHPQTQDLSNVLSSFEERTRTLRAHLEAHSGFVHDKSTLETEDCCTLGELSPLASLPSNTPFPTLRVTGRQQQQQQQIRSAERLQSNGAVRHTLKSAAAAAAAATKRGTDDCSPRITALRSNSRTGDGIMRRTSPVLLPQPGSTAALVSEVSDLRRKLANSVARMQASASAHYSLD